MGSEGITLDQAAAALWRLRRRVLALTLLLGLGGAAVILLWPRSHVAQAVLAPAETSGMAISSLLAPGSAAQAALLEARPAGNFAVFLAALRARDAAAMLARDTPLLDHLTAARADWPLGPLRRLLGLRVTADLDDAAQWLERRLAVTQSIGSVTWTISLAHQDRDLALLLLQRLLQFAEAKLADDMSATAARRSAAIQARLVQETDSFLRNALYELLGQQQRAALMVASDGSLAARLVAPPMVELRPSQPNRPLLLLLLAVLAPLVSLLLVLCGVLLRGRPA